MTGSTSAKPLIEHADEMEAYSPPNHQGTRNVRLVDREFCGGYEMIRGIVQPGGEAEPHYHDAETMRTGDGHSHPPAPVAPRGLPRVGAAGGGDRL